MAEYFDAIHGGTVIYLVAVGLFGLLIVRTSLALHRQDCRRSHEKFVLCMLIVLCMVSGYLNYETAKIIDHYDGQVSRLAIGTIARVVLECIMFYEVLSIFTKRKVWTDNAG